MRLFKFSELRDISFISRVLSFFKLGLFFGVLLLILILLIEDFFFMVIGVELNDFFLRIIRIVLII